MKVYKSVGAFDVYSRPRAASLVAGTAVLLAGAGFIGGVLVEKNSGSSSSSSAAPAATKAAAPSRPAPAATAGSTASSTTTRSAYRRGFHRGIAAVVSDPRGFQAGGTYVVRLTPGRNGAPFTIGPRVTVEAGNLYSLCRNGQHVCMKQGGLAGAP
jgi:hypothetical protein